MADEIRADYTQLQQVATQFSRQATAINRMQQQMKRSLSALQGNWIGHGSEAFFSEMSDKVLPATNRLYKALQEADRTTRQIVQVLQQAEQIAASYFQLQSVAPANPSPQNVAAISDPVTDEILKLLSYSFFDWSVTADEESRVLQLLRSSSNPSEVIRELYAKGMLDALFLRVNEGNHRRDLLRFLGSGLGDSARALVEPHVSALGRGAELQYDLARLGVDFTPANCDRSPYQYLISSDPSQPFTSVGATGENPTAQNVPLGDKILLGLGDNATETKYGNPLGNLHQYLNGLTVEQRQQQVELLGTVPWSVILEGVICGYSAPLWSSTFGLTGRQKHDFHAQNGTSGLL